jgi:hypothetical protein
MRNNTTNLRTKLIQETSLEDVRKNEREAKQKQRLKLKEAKDKKDKPIEVHSDDENKHDDDENEHDSAITELKQIEKQSKKMENKYERIVISDLIKQARADVATGKQTLPQAKKMIKDRLQKVVVDTQVEMNCDELVDTLDDTNLKYTDEKVNRKTLTEYLKRIGTIFKLMTGTDWNCTDWTWIGASDVVIDFIEGLYPSRKYGTISSYFNALCSILQRLDGYQYLVKEYKPFLIKYATLVKNERGKNVLTDREKPNYMPWGQILKYKDDDWNEEQHLLYTLYTAIPPRRNLDYSHLKYIKGKSLPKVKELDKTYNYISVNDRGVPKSIVINNYKTHKLYKTYTIDLNQKDQGVHFRYSEISKAIVKWAKYNKIENNDLVFPTKNGTVSSSFTSHVNDVFKGTGREIGVNILRHSFITSYLDKSPNSSDNSIKLFSDAMGNSVNQFRQYRRIDAEKDGGDN